MTPATTSLQGTPPFLNAAGLLLWGWQCNFLSYAVLMAGVIEIPRVLRWRIPVSDQEFNLVADLSAVLLLAVSLYIFSVNTYYGIYSILAALPFTFFLLLLAQRYSVRGKIRMSSLVISMRRAARDGVLEENPAVDLTYPYLLVCILAASAGNQQQTIFYVLLVLIFAWSLWWLKPRPGGVPLWLALFLLAAAAGYGGQVGVQRLQAAVEETIMGWFDLFTWRHRDPMRTVTAIGALGKLKLSDRIMVRVDTHGEKIAGRMLLRETTYTDYGYGVWTNFRHTLSLVDPTPDGTSWVVHKGAGGRQRVTISYKLDDDQGIIPLPLGLTAITNTEASSINASAFNAIVLELHPGWTRYDAMYTDAAIHDVEPLPEDTSLPPIYRESMQRLARELQLEHMPPARALATIENFFAENFSYSLTQSERFPRGRYLDKFLFENRRGHCEYFATATVLLLRAAGIPARYAVGYAIDEYSALERQYLGRGSHAHSWALAYLDGSWRVVDTTPPVWAAADDGTASLLRPAVDLWSWLTYTLDTWDLKDDEQGTRLPLWLALPVMVYLLWRLWTGKHRLPGALTQSAPAARYGYVPHPGFQALLARLEQKYFQRGKAEPLGAWMAKVESRAGIRGLPAILALYYRRRFDPRGLEEPEEARLTQLCHVKLGEIK